MRKAILLLGLILVSCSKDSGGDSPNPEPPEEKLKFTLTVSAGEGGSVDTAGGTYNEGTTVTVTATPDENYLFEKWSGTENSTNNPLNIVLTSNENITANFIEKFELTLEIEGEGSIEEKVIQSGKEYASGTEVELTAVAAEGWVFSSWSEALEGSDNPKNIVIDDNKTVKATFIRKSYELTVNVTGEGTVTEEVITAPSQYEFETELRLTAEPSQYWQFVGWSGDIESTDNPITFTIDKAYNLDATFELLDTDNDGVPDIDDLCPNTPAGESVDDFGCSPSDKIYIDPENGVTIKCPDANVGDSHYINGVNYVVVDNSTIREHPFLDDNDPNTCLCTSKVTDMSNLLRDRPGDNTLIKYDSWDVSNVTTMKNMFFNHRVNISLIYWDVSGVTDMSGMFYGARLINDKNFENWDTSNVTDMRMMFEQLQYGNPNIASWNTSNVIDMSRMFAYDYTFNPDISDWNTSNVTNMSSMFEGTNYVNPSIAAWNTSNVTNMENMFAGAKNFNQDIAAWDTSNVTSMKNMFGGAAEFNQNLSSWDVSKVTNCENFFNNYEIWIKPKPNFENCGFDSDGDGVSDENDACSETPLGESVDENGCAESQKDGDGDGVIDILDECPNTPQGVEVDDYGCRLDALYLDENGITIKANEIAIIGKMYTLKDNNTRYTIVDNAMLKDMIYQDVSKIVTSKVTSMSYLITYGRDNWNQDISTWDTSNVTTMEGLFGGCLTFNQDISFWDTSNVTNMEDMFAGAESFNQDISSWDVSSVTNMTNMFYDARNFNQNIRAWNVSEVILMEQMFMGAANFNQDISFWDVSSVTSMDSMFRMLYGDFPLTFNQDLSNWDVFNVTKCRRFSDGVNSWTLPKPNFTNCDPNSL